MTKNTQDTPPPELVTSWSNSLHCPDCQPHRDRYIAEQAARWGAQKELEACCAYLKQKTLNGSQFIPGLRGARWPSLKQQALTVLPHSSTNMHTKITLDSADVNLIRQAIESLPD